MFPIFTNPLGNMNTISYFKNLKIKTRIINGIIFKSYYITIIHQLCFNDNFYHAVIYDNYLYLI